MRVSESREDDWAIWNSGRIPKGWLPVAIRPATASRQYVVRWMRVGTADLTEPFFDFTVRRLRAQYPLISEWETTLDAILTPSLDLAPMTPSGMIFQMSRCGSTLLLNAMRSAEDVVGLGEAEPIESALTMAASRSDYWKEAGSSLLRALVPIFARYNSDRSKSIVLKFTPPCIACLPLIRSIWPTVPCLVLIRDPLEVVISNLMEPPLWLIERYTGQETTLLGRTPAEIINSTVESCAWFIGRFCSEAIRTIDEACMIVDYESLNRGSIRDLAYRFGLNFSPDREALFTSAIAHHSKTLNHVFKGDRVQKRRRVTPDVEESVTKWVTAYYEELKRRSVLS